MIHFPQRNRCTFQNVNSPWWRNVCKLVCLVPCCFLSQCYSPLSSITIINGALLMIKIVYVHSSGLLSCSIWLCSLWCVFLLDLYSASNSAAGPTLIGLHQAPFQSELIQPFKKTMGAFDARWIQQDGGNMIFTYQCRRSQRVYDYVMRKVDVCPVVPPLHC